MTGKYGWGATESKRESPESFFFFFFFFFTFWPVAPVGFLQGRDGLPEPVLAQAVFFIVAPVMLGSCFPPELILDSLNGFF